MSVLDSFRQVRGGLRHCNACAAHHIAAADRAKCSSRLVLPARQALALPVGEADEDLRSKRTRSSHNGGRTECSAAEGPSPLVGSSRTLSNVPRPSFHAASSGGISIPSTRTWYPDCPPRLQT